MLSNIKGPTAASKEEEEGMKRVKHFWLLFTIFSNCFHLSFHLYILRAMHRLSDLLFFSARGLVFVSVVALEQLESSGRRKAPFLNTQKRFSSMRVGKLFLAASMPVVKVILVTLVGSFIALDRVNIMNESARKHMNMVVFYVFNPALIFANLAKTITLQSLVTLWFMPLNILITFLIGSILGWVIIYLTRAPKKLRGLIMGCCSAGNLGNMLLIIIPAVCKEKGSPFGDKDVCHNNGMAYASLSLAIGSIYLWSYVYNIVRISSNKKVIEAEQNGSTCAVTDDASNCCEEDQLPSRNCSMSEDNANRSTLPYTVSDKIAQAQGPVAVTCKQQMKIFAHKMNLKKLFAPSTIGAIIGFIVGIIAPVRGLLIGQNAVLHVIQDSASLLGDGAIPTVSLVMGGNLTKGLKESQAHAPVIAGIIAVRYILSPLFGIFIVKGAIHFSLIRDDPLYKFVLLLQFAVPPAMNISTISQLFGAGESECSVIMLWAYTLASVALTLWSICFMWMVS